MKTSRHRGSITKFGFLALRHLKLAFLFLVCCRPGFAQQVDIMTVPWIFERPIEALGQTQASAQEGAVLKAAIQSTMYSRTAETFGLIEAFVNDNPSSAWTPALRVCIGQHYLETGRYIKTLEHWERVWEETKSYQTGPGKRVADYALAHWTRLLVALGRMEELELILAETRERHLDGGPLQQKFLRTQEAFGIVRRHPSASYRCGWMVLNNLSLDTRGWLMDPTKADALYQEQNLFQSCSMNALS